MTENIELLSDTIKRYYLEFAHVCQYGRNCTNKDSLHWEKSIHIHRSHCQFGSQCRNIFHEDHLNSFTRPDILDVRFLCKYADQCHDRNDRKHLSKFRHTIAMNNSGIVRYYNLNKNINFVQNQQDNIKRVLDYARKQKWQQLKSERILQEIIDWIRTVRPIHRCRSEILESILLHGHVMSRDYMENLKKTQCVIDSILQHSRLQEIKHFKTLLYKTQHIKEYVSALVEEEFEKNYSNSRIDSIKKKKLFFYALFL
jgi:hypothetical protein